LRCRPIKPDVAILHAAHADAYGNVQHIGGPGWIDLFMYRAADRTIVQVEKIISNEEVRADGWKTTIPAADAIVRAPFGAHPFYSRGYYIQDNDHLRDYNDAANSAGRGDSRALDAYFNRYCREPATLADYLERVASSGCWRYMSTEVEMDQPVNQHAGAWAIVGAVMWLAYGVLSAAGHWLGAGWSASRSPR